MTAPAGWQPGSWRGVAFVSMTQTQTGGRRGKSTELPQRELPVHDDFGRKAGNYSLTCYVIGADYMARADALGTALNAPGLGTLIHPWLGPMQVWVPNFTRTDTVSDGGIARFEIEFVEGGLPAVTAPTADTVAKLRAAAAVWTAHAPFWFADQFDLNGVQGFVEDHAADLVTLAATEMAIVSGLQGGIGPALRAVQANLGMLPPNIQAMLRSPADLGIALVGAAQSIVAIGAGSGSLVAGLIGLLDFGSDLPAITGATPARDRQRDNQAAIVQIVGVAVAGALAEAIAATGFASYQDAVATRDAAADALDRLALRQADAGDDDGAAAYDSLRRAIVTDVTARGGSLARLQRYTPAISEPAIVIAHRLYGPAGLEAREAEIVARNRIAHPGFVPGGLPIQVLTPSVAIGGLNG